MFKINKNVFRCGLLAFVFCIGSVNGVKAYEVEISEPYTWTCQMSSKAEEYDLNLREQRDTKLKELLVIDDEDLEKYLDDYNLFYNVSIQKGKLNEVEDIITKYEKDYMYYELFLLTGDENLANEYYTDPQIYFSFEKAI
ncbi:hypothetical protein [Candidatus Arthromitus sp. SFB-rat-Yit]|uniref:hypothetical protein n=1 Tax=Candidatus Arthromitus sp. SFB-rat-Yit TaxID=1041504 RepID=UPI000227A655|nr:hypothetical protein [Candidatus Arthromitus sp. SFB-rat-Yit]BAK81068.1 hypothetical protein RATSFB_0506 [Candidatus Arthromitus sp. SFB-rat-Yit]